MTLYSIPEDGRPIRIADTAETRRMGIAGWEGWAQGNIPDHGVFFFVQEGQLLGEHKIAIPASCGWWYMSEE